MMDEKEKFGVEDIPVRLPPKFQYGVVEDHEHQAKIEIRENADETYLRRQNMVEKLTEIALVNHVVADNLICQLDITRSEAYQLVSIASAIVNK